MTRAHAREALAEATNSAQAMRREARWMSTLLMVLALGFAAMTLVLGLAESLVAIIVLTAAFLVLTAVLAVWALRRRAMLKGAARRFVAYWMGTVVLYVLAPVIGASFGDDLRYWIPAAALVALPTLAGAMRERRS